MVTNVHFSKKESECSRIRVSQSVEHHKLQSLTTDLYFLSYPSRCSSDIDSFSLIKCDHFLYKKSLISSIFLSPDQINHKNWRPCLIEPFVYNHSVKEIHHHRLCHQNVRTWFSFIYSETVDQYHYFNSSGHSYCQ